MARTRKRTAQVGPLFDEPVFGEGVSTPDPSHFSTRHPSDGAEYKTIEQLLYKDVVSFPESRVAANQVFELATAFGPQGPQVIQQIQKNKQIVFHAVGDSGVPTSPATTAMRSAFSIRLPTTRTRPLSRIGPASSFTWEM